ncbi:MAG: mechanosensitive ion channel family protein [Luminiphilus sp.]|nr:mechanosensitive ion channel family protein [Luminiphilus sp.]
MSLRMLCCATLVAILGLSDVVSAQQDVALDSPPKDELTIAELSQEISRDVASLRAFESYPDPGSDERRKTLEVRRDEKTITVLDSILDLAERVLAMPEDAPERQKLNQLLIQRGELIEQMLVERYASLTERLNISLTSQRELSGSPLLLEESLGALLDEQRLQYLELSTEYVLLLEALELDSANLRERVLASLSYFGEEMMGLIHLHQHGLNMLAERQVADGTDTDLIVAAQFESERLKFSATRLRGVVEQLQRLDGDTLEMRRALIEVRGSLALSLVDTAIINVLYAEIIEKFEAWLSSRGATTLISALLFVLILIVSRWLGGVARRVTERALRHSDQSISQLLKETLISMAGTIVFLLGLLVALSQIGVSVAPMIAGLGVVGFIVGFALQDTLANFASGAMILAYRPFDTGDFISAADVEGEVRKMNLVNTTIVTIENKVLIIPNSKIWGGVILNFTGQNLRRTDVIYRVSFEDDLNKVQGILEELVASDERFLQTPEPVIRVKQFSDYSIDFLVRAYVKTGDFWESVWALNKAVKQRFDAEGITIPFPQRDVHMIPPDAAAPEQAS